MDSSLNIKYKKIKTIKKINNEDTEDRVYDISVKNNHNFILNDSKAVVHNCDLLQILKAENFNCSILSVDRVDTDKICKPYLFLKSAVYEKRFFMYNCKRLFDEFVDVERNINTGRVDHTQNYHKDMLDAVCGATFTCSKYAEKYAYDYGETYDLVLLTNVPGQATSAYLQQITVDFEDELKKVFGDFGIKNNENNCINNYNDNSMLYLEQGIIIL